MLFRDEFAWSHKLNTNWSSNRILDVGLRANLEQSKALQKNLKSLFDQASQSQMASSASLQREFAYQAHRFGEQVEHSSAGIVDAVEQSTESIVAAVQLMTDYLGGGLCEVRWAVERQTRVSVEILRVLLESLDNKSRQLLEQGIKWYERSEPDLAKECFIKALKANKTNYFAYQYLGFIAVEQDDPDQAVRNFDLAYKIAETSYHQAIALSHLARSYAAKNELSTAANKAKQATEAYDEAAKFWYEFAGYSARLGRDKESISALKETIERDWTYFAIVAVDNDFDLVRANVSRLLEELREQQKNETRQALDNLNHAMNTALKAGATNELSECQIAISNLEEQFRQNNVYIYRDLIPQAQEWHDKAFNIASRSLQERITDKKKDIAQAEIDMEHQIARLETPIDELRKRMDVVGSDYKDIDLGKTGYVLLLAIFGILIVPLLLFVARTANTAIESIQSSGLEYMILLLILLGIWFAVPYFLLQMANDMVNSRRRDTTVKRPKQQILNNIKVKEREIEPHKKKLEEEFQHLNSRLSKELSDLQSFFEKCEKRQYI